MAVSILHATTTAIISGTQWNEEHIITGFATVAETGAYSDLSGTPTLAAVALSGAYADLSGTPVVTNVSVSDAAGDTTTFVLLAGTATGDQGALTDSGLTYNATTNALTATTFVGSLNGNADTVTTNANLTGIVTSVGNATAIANGEISYTKLANGTDGELLTWDASGVIATVAVGTAGHVLTSNGAGAAPTFQAVSATDITVADTTDTTCFFGLWESATGSQAPKSDGAATYNASTGKATFTTVAGFVEPAAGTTTIPPVLLTSGTLMTTPSDGALEMDATNIYGCTDAGNRGYIPVIHFIRCNAARTLPNDTNLNAIFNDPTNGTLTLETGTYKFDGLFYITSMSATSGNALLDILGAGTATTGAWLYQVVGTDANTPTAAGTKTGSSAITSATPASMLTAGTGSAMVFQVFGTFEVTSAGTIIPSIDQVTASAAQIAIGSFMRFERMGTDSVVSVGQWT
jgi:hypothetical protein